MAAVKELLRVEEDGTLSFGDFTLAQKTKLDNFEFEGDVYKVKTFSEITKLESTNIPSILLKCWWILSRKTAPCC